MKIELQEPFKSLWRTGYLRESKKDGRKRIDLFNSNKDRTTISYARYLMSVHIGEIISDEFEVDHKDDDNSNDVIENLQILSKADHLEKTRKIVKTGRTMIECVCAFCGIIFEKEKRFVKSEYKNTFCSRSCNAKYSHKFNGFK